MIERESSIDSGSYSSSVSNLHKWDRQTKLARVMSCDTKLYFTSMIAFRGDTGTINLEGNKSWKGGLVGNWPPLSDQFISFTCDARGFASTVAFPNRGGLTVLTIGGYGLQQGTIVALSCRLHASRW